MMLSEIVQFHQLVNLVRELNKPVEMSDDSLIALDDDIILLEQQNFELLSALKEIAKMEGPYSRDPLTHAENVIENLTNIANKAIAKAEGER